MVASISPVGPGGINVKTSTQKSAAAFRAALTKDRDHAQDGVSLGDLLVDAFALTLVVTLRQTTSDRRPEAAPLLRVVAEERKRGKIFLRADGGIPYEGVQVMGALNASHLNDIGLVTEQGGSWFDGQDG